MLRRLGQPYRIGTLGQNPTQQAQVQQTQQGAGGSGQAVVFLDIDSVLNRHGDAVDAQIRVEPELVGPSCVAIPMACGAATRCAHPSLLLDWLRCGQRLRQADWRKSCGGAAPRCSRPSGGASARTSPTYILQRNGLSRGVVVDHTPGTSGGGDAPPGERSYGARSDEIHAWLDAHRDVTCFVVLGDRTSAADEALAPHFVHTESAAGLTPADVRKALEILQHPSPSRL